MMKQLSLFLSLLTTGFLFSQDLPETLWNDLAQTDWYDETQTQFEISNAEDLAGLSVLVADGNDFDGKTILLTADIDLDGNLWTSVGPEINASFSGTFDGNDFTVSNVIINQPENDFAGFFGSVLNAEIKNIKIQGAIVYGKSTVGGLVANLSTNSSIENSSITDGFVQCEIGQYGGIAGGLVGGLLTNSTVKSSSYSGEVHGGDQIGGLVGTAWDTTLIEESFSEGLVHGDNIVGGLVGYTTMNFPPNPDSRNIVRNCYSRSNVVATGVMAGGLYGTPETNGGIENSYSTGTVEAAEEFGGSIGKILYDTYVTNTYWDTESSNMTEGIGDYTPDPEVSVEGKTTEEMKSEEMVSLLNADQDPVWTIDENKNDGYPILISTTLSAPSYVHVSQIVIFPSVTDHLLNIESEVSGSYSIIDMTGKMILQGDFDKTNTIDVSAFQSGTYMIVFEHENRKTTKRFIKN